MTTAHSPVGVGIIGAGSISLLHARGLASLPSARIMGFYDRQPQAAAEAAARHGGRVYDSADALLADPAVQAVFVLTHLDSHGAYALAALAAGKHVLVEKPVAPSLEDLDTLTAAAAKAQRVCMPGHNYVYEPSLWRLRAMIAAGEIGRLAQVAIHYNIHHPEEVARNYPGVITQIMTHHAYLLAYLLGPGVAPLRLAALKGVVSYTDYRAEEQASVILELPGGGLAHFFAAFTADDPTADPWTFLVKVLGTAGGGRFSYRDHVSTLRRGGQQLHSQWYEAYQGGITQQAAHFINACILDGKPPLSTLADARLALQIVRAAEVAARDGCLQTLA